MCSARDDAALPAPGLPIRVSAGQRLFSASPRLIAAVHALHRLLVPRHPPCALTILTVIFEPLPVLAHGHGLDELPVVSITTPSTGDAVRLMWLLCSFQGPLR